MVISGEEKSDGLVGVLRDMHSGYNIYLDSLGGKI